MPKTSWEYKIDVGITTDGRPEANAIRPRLNKNGKDGWELVQVLSRRFNNEIEDWWVYKRPSSIAKVSQGKIQKRGAAGKPT